MNPKQKIRRWAPILIQAAILAGLAVSAWYSLRPSLRANSVQTVSYSDFLQAIRDGKVKAVEISSTEIRGQLRHSQSNQPQIISAVRPPDLNDPELVSLLKEKQVEVVGKLDTPSYWRTLLVGD